MDELKKITTTQGEQLFGLFTDKICGRIIESRGLVIKEFINSQLIPSKNNIVIFSNPF